MTAPTAVAPGAGFSGATAVFNTNWSNDTSAVVTFTTASTIPSSPYLIFTITFAGSWTSQYPLGLVVLADACAASQSSRSAAYMLATAALGPFYTIPSFNQTTCAVYCTNAPAITTSYDIGFIAVPGP